jgi:hypothetical protein
LPPPAVAHQAAEALQLERQLGDLVNEACGLTPEEVALIVLQRTYRR